MDNKLDLNELKWVAASILADVVKSSNYKELFTKGDKGAIRKITVEKLYEKGIYCKPKYKLFKGYNLVKCTKEECEKYLNKNNYAKR